MPLPAKTKWIIFPVICCLQIASAGGFLVFFLVRRGWPFRFYDLTDALYSILLFLVCTSFIANSISNLYLVQRFLPDQAASRPAIRFNLVLFIMVVISSILIIILTIYIYISQFSRGYRGVDYSFLLIITLTVLSVSSLFVWFMQPDLRKTLKRNQDRDFEQFLEAENP